MIADHRAALVVAHPGHELRVHGWLEVARPVVCVSTDGSGHGALAVLHGSRTVRVRDRLLATPLLGNLVRLGMRLAKSMRTPLPPALERDHEQPGVFPTDSPCTS